MRWQEGRRSENVEDVGGSGRRGPVMMGGGIGMLVLVVVMLLLGADPRKLLQLLQNNGGGPGVQVGPQEAGPEANDPVRRELKEFSSVILADTEDVWTNFFERSGKSYKKPVLVLFSGQVQSGCGAADAGMGPFYCPADERVYLDLAFFQELEQKFRAPGDFARAYVIAHEIGHHVQNLLGVSDKVHQARNQLSESEYNQLSVRLELQADFYAGVWAHHAHKNRNILEKGDIEEGLAAATAIGDDRLQKQTRGYVQPDSFTHGTSDQRVRWFMKGLKTGDLNQGDTFRVSADEL